MPLRSFGSVSKAELMKEVYGDVIAAVDWKATLVGATWGALINGGVDDAVMQFKVPASFTDTGEMFLICLGVANVANMNLNCGFTCGHSLESPLARGQNTPLTFTTVANQLVYVDMGMNPAVAVRGDIVTVYAYYDAVAPASNVYVLGVYLTWR